MAAADAGEAAGAGEAPVQNGLHRSPVFSRLGKEDAARVLAALRTLKEFGLTQEDVSAQGVEELLQEKAQHTPAPPPGAPSGTGRPAPPGASPAAAPEPPAAAPTLFANLKPVTVEAHWTVDAAVAMVGDMLAFHNLEKVLPPELGLKVVGAIDGNDMYSERTVNLPGGGLLVERVVGKATCSQPGSSAYTYSLIDRADVKYQFPLHLHDFLGTVVCAPVGEAATLVTWFGTFWTGVDPAVATAAIRGMYGAIVAKVKALAAAGGWQVAAPPPPAAPAADAPAAAPEAKADAAAAPQTFPYPKPTLVAETYEFDFPAAAVADILSFQNLPKLAPPAAGLKQVKVTDGDNLYSERTIQIGPEGAGGIALERCSGKTDDGEGTTSYSWTLPDSKEAGFRFPMMLVDYIGTMAFIPLSEKKSVITWIATFKTSDVVQGAAGIKAMFDMFAGCAKAELEKRAAAPAGQ